MYIRNNLSQLIQTLSNESRIKKPEIKAFAWSPINNNLIAILYMNKEIVAANIVTNRFMISNSCIYAENIQWSPDGIFLTINGIGSVMYKVIFNENDIILNRVFDDNLTYCNSINWSQDSNFFALNCGSECKIFEIKNNDIITEKSILPNSSIFCFSKSNRYCLIKKDTDKTNIFLQDLRTNILSSYFLSENFTTDNISTITFLPNESCEISFKNGDSYIGKIIHAYQLKNYFFNPIPLEELILLQAIENSSVRNQKYILNAYWQRVFNNIGTKDSVQSSSSPSSAEYNCLAELLEELVIHK